MLEVPCTLIMIDGTILPLTLYDKPSTEHGNRINAISDQHASSMSALSNSDSQEGQDQINYFQEKCE